MTVKKRLFLSNILMIAVPVVITLIVGVCCMGAVWFTLQHGTGLRFEDSGDFYWASRSAVEMVEHALDADEADRSQRFHTIGAVLRAGAMRLVVEDESGVLYSDGDVMDGDANLLQAAEQVGMDETTVSTGTRSIFLTYLSSGERSYRVTVYGTQAEIQNRSVKLAAVLACILLLFTIFVSIFGTNRFLTKFVFRKIEEPLDILADGVKEIGDGNLDFRIDYTGKDEFAPVCTAFNEMAERLKVTVERTQRDEESRKELLAGISHDIRSPLTSIQAYVEGLLDGVAATPEAQRQYLTTVKKKAQDIDRLVSQLFLFSKLELDEYPMALRPLRLDEMAVMLMQETEGEYLQKGLEVSVAADPATVMADPEQLRRVLTNIMDNSAKYKAGDMGHLQITVKSSGSEGCITLADDGPGVSEDALPKLFDVFYRSDPARKNPAGGSGLGLAIAAKTIQKMGGTIRAANRPEGGLSITITLPGEEADHAEHSDH